MNHFLQRLARLDAHHRLLISLAVAALAAGILGFTSGPMDWARAFVIVWLTYALTVLILSWITITQVHPRDISSLSRLEDSSRMLILVFVLLAVGLSLFAVVTLLGTMQSASRTQVIAAALLALGAIVSSWLLVHTLFTLRYAHLFYGDDVEGKTEKGGLDFPGEPEPDYLDFAYFSFVIGMTSQVSDVAISCRPMRRLALLHGVLSFGFNTLIIALSINTLSGLI